VILLAVCGGIIDVHQHDVEEKASLWRPLTPFMKDDSKPGNLQSSIAPDGAVVYPFSIPPR
jgi:hypothetical protein